MCQRSKWAGKRGRGHQQAGQAWPQGTGSSFVKTNLFSQGTISAPFSRSTGGPSAPLGREENSVSDSMSTLRAPVSVPGFPPHAPEVGAEQQGSESHAAPHTPRQTRVACTTLRDSQPARGCPTMQFPASLPTLSP